MSSGVIHSEKRPFQCDDYDKAFITSSDMVRHKRIHSGKDPSSVINVTRHLVILLVCYNIRGYTVGKDPSSAMNVIRHSVNLLVWSSIR